MLFALHAPWAIPALLAVRAVRPWVLVRMGTLFSSRIGHFLADASILLAERDLMAPADRSIDLVWLPEETSNAQWARMVRRHLFVRWWVRYLDGFNRLLPGGKIHCLPWPTQNPSREIYSPLRKTQARLVFTSDEDARAKSWLKQRGWQEGEAFVCLLVRDSAYLGSHTLHSKFNWSYHDYRDSDIDTYVDAVEALLAKGYWVIRMGKIMHKPLPLRHPKVIDYPFVQDQDDLLDIWLSVKCSFFISTGTGIDVIPGIYEIPMVFVNALPLVFPGAAWHESVWVPKHLHWTKTGTPLTLGEHVRHAYTDSAEYASAGITIRGLEPDEITSAVMEIEQRSQGNWTESTIEAARQQRYWQFVKSFPETQPFYSYIHPKARIGNAWLQSMGEAFFA